MTLKSNHHTIVHWHWLLLVSVKCEHAIPRWFSKGVKIHKVSFMVICQLLGTLACKWETLYTSAGWLSSTRRARINSLGSDRWRAYVSVVLHFWLNWNFLSLCIILFFYIIKNKWKTHHFLRYCSQEENWSMNAKRWNLISFNAVSCT